jgi:hypothetical protein
VSVVIWPGGAIAALVPAAPASPDGASQAASTNTDKLAARQARNDKLRIVISPRMLT